MTDPADKMIATIFSLREAATKLTHAANRLDAQDGFHRDHALELIRLATQDTERCTRQITRQFDANRSST